MQAIKFSPTFFAWLESIIININSKSVCGFSFIINCTQPTHLQLYFRSFTKMPVENHVGWLTVFEFFFNFKLASELMRAKLVPKASALELLNMVWERCFWISFFYVFSECHSQSGTHKKKLKTQKKLELRFILVDTFSLKILMLLHFIALIYIFHHYLLTLDYFF